MAAACTASIGANAIVAATIAAIAGRVKLCGIFIVGLAAVRIIAAGGGAIGPRCTRSASDAVIGASSIVQVRPKDSRGFARGSDVSELAGPEVNSGTNRLCIGK